MPTRATTRYQVHGYVNGSRRVIETATPEMAARVQAHLNLDPSCSYVQTVPVTRAMSSEGRLRRGLIDVIVGIAIVVALLYGVGIL